MRIYHVTFLLIVFYHHTDREYRLTIDTLKENWERGGKGKWKEGELAGGGATDTSLRVTACDLLSFNHLRTGFIINEKKKLTFSTLFLFLNKTIWYAILVLENF